MQLKKRVLLVISLKKINVSEKKKQINDKTSGIAKGKKDKSAKITEAWLEKHKDQFEQLRSLFEKLRRAGTIELPMLVIAEQRLRNLADV